jgi:hypothetical protein
MFQDTIPAFVWKDQKNTMNLSHVNWHNGQVCDELLLKENSGAVALAHLLGVIIQITFYMHGQNPGNAQLCEREACVKCCCILFKSCCKNVFLFKLFTLFITLIFHTGDSYFLVTLFIG